jgi:methionyl-tRNA formyltransferase
VRVVFFGTPELAVPSLAAATEHHEVTAVVCQPDRPRGRSKKLVPPPVKVWAEEHGIAVAQPEKLNDGTFEKWLKDQSPDVCVIAAYGRILKQPILDIPKHGFVNVHPSLLPKYRGPSPIRSAILNGEEVTGVSIMRLVLEMDAGDIILQEEVAIQPDENAVDLTNRLSKDGAALLAGALDLIERGVATHTSQDPAKVTHCSMFTKRDGAIQWDAPARVIHNLVRAAHPWPVAHCLYEGQVCRIHATRIVDEATHAAPGTVIRTEKDHVVVAVGQGAIAILLFQPPGKRAMPMEDYLRGHPITPGQIFESVPNRD